MPSVNRIFRLRSTVRSDEMKAESTLSSCTAGLSYHGVLIGWRDQRRLSLVRDGPGQANGLRRSRVGTVYETNSCIVVAPNPHALSSANPAVRIGGYSRRRSLVNPAN